MGLVSVRLSDDVLNRIGAVSSNRSDFIRDAIEAALVRADGKNSLLTEDQRDLLALVRQEGSVGARGLEARLGWGGLRYQRAERGLSAAGLIRFEGGRLVANGPS